MSARIVELVGPPGVGKSTLVHALVRQGGGRIRRATLRGARNFPLLLTATLRLSLPLAVRARQLGPRRWRRFSEMVQLEAHYAALSRDASAYEAVLLDQGPVYLLSLLSKLLPSAAPRGSHSLFAFRESALSRWAERLDLVVLLDAADEVLYRRVRERGSAHPVLRMSRDEAAHHFQRIRLLREAVVSQLQTRGDQVRVLRLRTDELPLQACVDELLGRLLADAA